MLKKAIILCLDIICSLLIIPVFILQTIGLVIAVRARGGSRGNLLHISSASSTNKMLNKFGSFKALFDFDGNATEGVFDKVVLFWFPSENSLRYDFDNGWVVLEQRKVLGRLPLTGLLVFWLRLFRILVTEEISIVRGWDAYLSGFSALIINVLFGIPYCVSVHADFDKLHELDPINGAPKILSSRKIAKYLERQVLKNADMVMPIRQYLADKVITNGARPDSIRVIPHGIDMTPFKHVPKLDFYSHFNIDKGRKIVSFVGRLSHDNYIYDVIEVARRLTDDVLMIIAGGGTEEAKVKSIIEEDEALARKVMLLGFQNRETCFELRKISTVSLCLMGGLSLIEACAAGSPVIAYDVEWHSELVKDGETGFLIQEHDTSKVSELLEYLLQNPHEAKNMGNNARELVFKTHDISNTALIKRNHYIELKEKANNGG
ncbi:MAG: glycosyltransferase family 4 protein [Candidatus Saccharibacteria bacterium]